MQNTYVANATTKINLTYEQTRELVIEFLEKEYDDWAQNLQNQCISYAKEQKDFIFEDMQDSLKILNSMQHVIELYREP